MYIKISCDNLLRMLYTYKKLNKNVIVELSKLQKKKKKNKDTETLTNSINNKAELKTKKLKMAIHHKIKIL